MIIKPLTWDSDFFRLRIGQLHLTDYSKELFESELKNFDLVYIYDDYYSRDVSRIIEGAVKVDEKITFTKIINKHKEPNSEIKIYNRPIPTDQLKLLSVQSGIYSRFRLDTNFPKGYFEQLYHEWIYKSCTKEIAFAVLVHGDEAKPDGFITLSSKEDNAVIGLIAVDEGKRGLGIGKKLLYAAEYIAEKNNFTNLKVATQYANKEACHLYEKYGFDIESRIAIYHYWNLKDENTL